MEAQGLLVLRMKIKLNQSSNKAIVVPTSIEIEPNVIGDIKSKNKMTNKKTIEVKEGKIERGRNMEGKIDQANRTDERSTEESALRNAAELIKQT